MRRVFQFVALNPLPMHSVFQLRKAIQFQAPSSCSGQWLPLWRRQKKTAQTHNQKTPKKTKKHKKKHQKNSHFRTHGGGRRGRATPIWWRIHGLILLPHHGAGSVESQVRSAGTRVPTVHNKKQKRIAGWSHRPAKPCFFYIIFFSPF